MISLHRCLCAGVLAACHPVDVARLEFVCTSQAQCADGWLCVEGSCRPNAYASRRRITVHNAAAGELPAGYAVAAPADAAAAVFLDGPSLTELDRVADDAAVWFALQRPIAAGADDSSYWLYSSDGGVSPHADGHHVFALFDDFDGPALSAVWRSQGPVALDGGALVLHGGGAHEGVTTSSLDDGVPAVNVLEVRAALAQPAAAGSYWLGYQRHGDFQADVPWVLWVARSPGAVHPEAQDGACSPCTLADRPQRTGFRTYRIERAANEARFFLDGAAAGVISLPATEDLSLMMLDGSSSDLLVDWARARPLVSPEPTVSLGADEPAR